MDWRGGTELHVDAQVVHTGLAVAEEVRVCNQLVSFIKGTGLRDSAIP